MNGFLSYGVENDILTIAAPYMEYGEDTLEQKDIKSIVTKEQYNSMKYIVGE